MQAKTLLRIAAIGLASAGGVVTGCAPVIVVPAEAPTPEAATQQAADPKAPGGALIIKKPDEVPPPATAPPR